jgi:hypothetical protein
MTNAQERAITLALNILHVGFFECPKHFYEYFIDNDEWALLMAAAGLNAVHARPQEVALAVLQSAVARRAFFEGMTDFKPPAHFCSFLRDKAGSNAEAKPLEPCREHQRDCPYATFENMKQCGMGQIRKPSSSLQI